ncbi:restriction endonuclease [Faecalibacterium sp. An77]|uniref:DEAD/DEAH box helicase n=1 Tax=Faecalibacterium sp. An77 TaxID=1965655 RepID=UPI000B39112D|nr:DEAD/DEAH box helicase family protein [Faecalibacterium sp. An77]OUN38140.1 restriction endonuclease [Faecalibacterium sp. An77]
MAGIVAKIGYAMSLRKPQQEALSYLDAISTHCDYKNDSKVVIEVVATEYCEKQRKIKVDDKFDFPSFCYAMATGIGKTRLMGASIYYLYKTKGYRHFFILAPGNTIYEKLRKESNLNHPKYIFKGLESEMGRPKVYDGENYDSYPVRYEQMSLQFEKSSEIELFIFNIGKIFNSKTDTQFNFHKFKETLGMSFAEVLSSFDDLVICMDEAHRYYAPASMKAINFLKPVLGLEFTATPKSTNNVIYAYDLARGAVEGYLKTPVVMGRSNMAGYNAEDIEEMKIRDGLTLHEHRKGVIRQFCNDNGLPYVKPIVLIACRDTNHAKEIRTLIDNDRFLNGRYKGKVIEIHSNMKGDESEENIRLLLSIEYTQNPVEIVLHVYKLKEGWDVNNLFTIIPLNAAKSDILAMQTIGRGLRLPFGQTTGNEDIDTLDIVAHDHYRELVDEIKNSDIFRYRDLDKSVVEPSDTVDISSPVDEDQLTIFDFAVTDAGVKSFSEINTNTKTQQELYEAYLKAFGSGKKQEQIPSDMQQLTMEQIFGTEAGNAATKPDEITHDSPVDGKGKKPLSKDEFVQKIKEYSGKAISVPKILVQTTSEVKFNRFEVKRNISDFEVAMAKIERFDAINQQLLTAVDAQILEVDDALNTLACMLLDSISELSYEDADFIIDVVDQYLAQIDGNEEDKRKIVRRYASLIVSDIRKQIFEHTECKTEDIHIVQKDLILFRKFVKNVKKDGRVRFDKPFTDKANIKKYLFTGYKKAYYTENAFDSDPERLFSIILEEDPDVIRWIKPPLNQLGLFWQAGQQYNPDFLVETTSGKFMVEVKASNEITADEVVTKAREGIKWCHFASTADPDHKVWEYRLISDDNIKLGNTCKYTLGTAHKIKEG